MADSRDEDMHRWKFVEVVGDDQDKIRWDKQDTLAYLEDGHMGQPRRWAQDTSCDLAVQGH